MPSLASPELGGHMQRELDVRSRERKAVTQVLGAASTQRAMTRPGLELLSSVTVDDRNPA